MAELRKRTTESVLSAGLPCLDLIKRWYYISKESNAWFAENGSFSLEYKLRRGKTLWACEISIIGVPVQRSAQIKKEEKMNTQSARDPVVTDSDKYKVVFENEHMRVLDYQDKPGQKTNEHRHPAFFLYALSPFKRNIHLEGGKVIVREFKTGDTIWSEEQVHIGENVGETDTHALIVELKKLT